MRPFIPPGILSKTTGIHIAGRPEKAYQERDVYFSNENLSMPGRLHFPLSSCWKLQHICLWLAPTTAHRYAEHTGSSLYSLEVRSCNRLKGTTSRNLWLPGKGWPSSVFRDRKMQTDFQNKIVNSICNFIICHLLSSREDIVPSWKMAISDYSLILLNTSGACLQHSIVG